MEAYKCDVCGQYCDDVYANNDDTFDIFTRNSREYGLENRHICIRHMCDDCYQDITTYIHNKYLENHKLNKSEELENGSDEY